MPTCPACGSEVGDHATECPSCQLSVKLFDAVREAAGPATDHDPAYIRTIGELLATVDLAKSEAPAREAASQGLLTRPRHGAARGAPPSAHKRKVRPIEPIRDLPPLPSAGSDEELRRRVREYFELGRRLGADFTEFGARANAAAVAGDRESLNILAREMFVHLLSSLTEEFEATLAARNEISQLIPTPSADVELDAIRESIRLGDLAGGLRRMAHVRDELVRLEEEWEVGKILVSECDLLSQTIRDLGGDPGPAQGPLEEGRKLVLKGRRPEAEKLLARAAVALWTVLEPRLFEDLRRIRDRMHEARSAGADIGGGVTDLRDLATELRQRNFVGMLMAYRRLRSFAEQLAVPEATSAGEPAVLASAPRPGPPA
ncbi:MAG TPA: hypothetical protein VEG66_08650 [Thermoplasmata archaeon]|nr:hypothetical protein [Thermoplasmata archaeon]